MATLTDEQLTNADRDELEYHLVTEYGKSARKDKEIGALREILAHIKAYGITHQAITLITNYEKEYNDR